MENKFNVGQVVYHSKHPGVRFVIKRFFYIIYYCQKEKGPETKDFVFFERELTDAQL